MPLVFVKYLQARRIDTFDEQLMDVVTLLSNSLKSGLGLQQAMELVVKQVKAPAYLAISERTMEFDGKGKCVSGC